MKQRIHPFLSGLCAVLLLVANAGASSVSPEDRTWHGNGNENDHPPYVPFFGNMAGVHSGTFRFDMPGDNVMGEFAIHRKSAHNRDFRQPQAWQALTGAHSDAPDHESGHGWHHAVTPHAPLEPVSTAVIPVPAAVWLFLSGLAGLATAAASYRRS